MRAIQIQEFGGPEVLVLRDLPEPEAPEGFVVVDVAAAGINYADTHQAENSYLAPAELPLVPGGEVVGTTADGRRVVALVAGGGYAERAVAHPAAMWDVPDGVSDAAALALVLQGTTAWHLLRTSAQLREGESVVNAEPGTTNWFAIRFENGDHGVFDVFPNPKGRRAHLAGEIPQQLAIHGLPWLDRLIQSACA